MAFSGAFASPFQPAFDRGAVVTPWYRAGGAPTPIAVYQPKGAISLAASYVNLANPGTYDAAPVTNAPTHASATGWTFDGIDQSLTTGIQPALTWSMLCRFTDATTSGYKILVGYYITTNQGFGIFPLGGGTNFYACNGNEASFGAQVVGGVAAIADRGVYVDGVSRGNLASSGSVGVFAIRIGGQVARYLACKIQAVAIWNTSTNHATWMPAVSAAVALI